MRAGSGRVRPRSAGRRPVGERRERASALRWARPPGPDIGGAPRTRRLVSTCWTISRGRSRAGAPGLAELGEAWSRRRRSLRMLTARRRGAEGTMPRASRSCATAAHPRRGDHRHRDGRGAHGRTLDLRLVDEVVERMTDHAPLRSATCRGWCAACWSRATSRTLEGAGRSCSRSTARWRACGTGRCVGAGCRTAKKGRSGPGRS